MAQRIVPEEQAKVRKGARETMADLSEQHPMGLPDPADAGLDDADSPIIRVSGGGDPLDRKKSALGGWWKCIVRDLKMPDVSNPLPVRVASDGPGFYKVVRTNRPTILPDAAIKMLQQGPVVTSKIRVRQTSPLYGKDEAARKANDDCEVVWEKGNMFLYRRRPRFSVERLEQLAGPPSGRAGVEL